MRDSHTALHPIEKSILYRIVFEMRFVRFIAGAIFIFFLLHPIVPAFASEDIPLTAEMEPALITQESELVSSSAPETVTAPEEVSPQESFEGGSIPEASGDSGIQEGTIVDATTDDDQVLLNDTPETLPSNEESPEIDTQISPEINSFVPDVNFLENTIDNSSSSDDIFPAVFSDPSEVSAPDDVQDVTGQTSSIVTSEVSTSTTSVGSNQSTESNQQEEISSTSLTTLSELLASSTSSESELIAQVAGVSTSTEDTIASEEEVSPTANDNTESPGVEETPVTGASLNDNGDENTAIEEFDQETASTTQDAPIGTTTPIAEVTLPQQQDTVTNNLNAYQFADKECVSVGDGSFYCSAIDSAPEYVEDGVFSAPDSGGDMEIFVTINGKTTQITNNLTDDSSPYYDGISNTIVWHSMKNDRFQIAQYDVDTGDITYLTDASYNNMEPVAYGDLVLWQAWIGNNWEIMMLNNGTVSQLTNNTMHDITPQIRDGYIMWQTQFAEGWKIALYDTKTKKVNYIADSDGSEVKNPRFVLVYDTTDEVGDVQTLGYDFGSGSSFVLGNLPTEVPRGIPQPDQTGETRALIQAKPTARENEVRAVVPTTSGNGSSTPSVTASSSVQAGDLVVQPLGSTSASTSPATTTQTAQATATQQVSSDIVPQATSTDTSHIEDVVIPPFSASSTQEVG